MIGRDSLDWKVYIAQMIHGEIRPTCTLSFVFTVAESTLES